MAIVLISIYILALSLIFLYSLGQLNLLLNYRLAQKKADTAQRFDFTKTEEIPWVTLQLPLFNELYVVERLLEAVAQLDYPKEKLEIQVLDDSTDESLEITAQLVGGLKEQGFLIEQIKRTNRQGFKAGALREGLAYAKGEFIAIFDADFIPQASFLKQTVPYFKDSKIGAVQTRWGHTNRNFSVLTKSQAFALDAHFTIEQVGRNSKNHFINFNGTAGVWRKACINDAGNWQSDTLTEDLDLSYRSQLKGWKFKYLEHVETPAELPMVISAARSQQFRWNKGGAENFRKMKGRLVNNKDISVKTKIHGLLHLLNSSMFLSVFVVAVLSIPMLYLKFYLPQFSLVFKASSIFVFNTLIFYVYYWHAYRKFHGTGFRNFMRYTRDFFTFFTIAMGLSLHNSIAVLEGHMGKKSAFVRTPKFNLGKVGGSWRQNKYLQTQLTVVNWLEGLLMLYFIFGIYSAFRLMDYGLLPFHLMLALGFGFVFYKSVTCRV
jgi:cellulose synthase/poly-beta-1,6-N-acetylglucosamine synthase-like glycosyltransferase